MVNALIQPEILLLLEKNGMPQNTGTGKDFLKDSKISGNNIGKWDFMKLKNCAARQIRVKKLVSRRKKYLSQLHFPQD